MKNKTLLVLKMTFFLKAMRLISARSKEKKRTKYLLKHLMSLTKISNLS